VVGKGTSQNKFNVNWKEMKMRKVLLGLALTSQFLCMNLAHATRFIYDICEPVSKLPDAFNREALEKNMDMAIVARALQTGFYWGISIPDWINDNRMSSNIGPIVSMPGNDEEFARVKYNHNTMDYPVNGLASDGRIEITIDKLAQQQDAFFLIKFHFIHGKMSKTETIKGEELLEINHLLFKVQLKCKTIFQKPNA